MKQIFLLIALFSFILVSCKETNGNDPKPTDPEPKPLDGEEPKPTLPKPTSLDGQWRMIMVKDITSGLTTTKPTSIKRDVDISLTSTSTTTGTITGKTPANTIFESKYLTGPDQTLQIPSLDRTKVGEPFWGDLCTDNMIKAESYSFEIGGKLHIKTTNKILTFQKL